MLIPNHPDPERLSALASHDDDATADAALTSHVSSCDRCAALVAELGALRASLADLPDLAPSRPLRLLPPVADAPAAAGAGGWVRRLFAPMLTAGAAIAMVGLVGTTAPLLGGMASSGAAPMDAGEAAVEDPASSLSQTMATDDAAAPAMEGGGEAAAGQSPDAGDGDSSRGDVDPNIGSSQEINRFSDSGGDGGEGQNEDGDGLTTLPAERSPWPMVLFAGVTLVIAALLLRWILVPRAG